MLTLYKIADKIIKKYYKLGYKNFNLGNIPSIKNIDIWYDGVNHTFQYEVGMTWGEWVDSDYNPTNIEARDDQYYTGYIWNYDDDLGYMHVDDGSSCEHNAHANDIINDSYRYRLGWDLGRC